MPSPPSVAPSRAPAFFHAPIGTFVTLPPATVLGHLTAASPFAVDVTQRDAWLAEIDILRAALAGVDGHVYLEFDIPRLGSRVDTVVVTRSAVFPIEFKVGESKHGPGDRAQAWDYGLDLKNFHEASHDAPILPILVATESTRVDADWPPTHPDGVHPPRCANGRSPRARQGMVIFVPRGEPADPTRRAELYDETFEYLRGLGIEEVG